MALGFLVLLLFAALAATSDYLSFVPWEGATGAMRIHWPWWRTFLVTAGQWSALLPFIFVIERIAAATPLKRRHWKKSLLHHGLAILVLSPLHFLTTRAIYFFINAMVSTWKEALEIMSQIPFRVFLSHIFVFPIIYGALAALCYAWTFHRKEREKEHKAALLERQLAQSQLQILRMQLNPHFLFNTLNGIVTLMRRDPDTAECMMLSLTDFLRATLEAGADLETPLAHELEMVERYLAIERLRFPGRFSLEKDIHPEALQLSIPSFLLQPLVENAVRHGLGPRASGGRLRIQAHLVDGSLLLAVEDDGVGPQEHPSNRIGGLGLANTKERLIQQYGTDVHFKAGKRPEGGFRVSMLLPQPPCEAMP